MRNFFLLSGRLKKSVEEVKEFLFPNKIFAKLKTYDGSLMENCNDFANYLNDQFGKHKLACNADESLKTMMEDNWKRISTTAYDESLVVTFLAEVNKKLEKGKKKQKIPSSNVYFDRENLLFWPTMYSLLRMHLYNIRMCDAIIKTSQTFFNFEITYDESAIKKYTKIAKQVVDKMDIGRMRNLLLDLDYYMQIAHRSATDRYYYSDPTYYIQNKKQLHIYLLTIAMHARESQLTNTAIKIYNEIMVNKMGNQVTDICEKLREYAIKQVFDEGADADANNVADNPNQLYSDFIKYELDIIAAKITDYSENLQFPLNHDISKKASLFG